MSEEALFQSRLKLVRLCLWLLVALLVLATATLYLIGKSPAHHPQLTSARLTKTFGGPFTLVGADGKPFSTDALAGKPYAIYFGFTRCGDTCPTTLSRLVRLRRKARAEPMIEILFVTIDPAHDGPREVGQYASLFSAPIIGLTGTAAQIATVKKHYGIYAEPVMNGSPGKEVEHSASVLLFDRQGQFAGTILPDEQDSEALASLSKLLG